MRPSPSTSLSYRPDIDGLRAVAIILVIAFHAFPETFHAGFIGVDIFFVISGYLITRIILGKLETKSFSFLEFYAHRIRRIFPALILTLVAVIVIGWLVYHSGEFQKLGAHVSGAGGFFSNFILMNEAGYFDDASAKKPLLHLWSLAIEEQFYLLWPVCLWGLHRFRANLLVSVIIITALSFGMNMYYVRLSQAVTDFYMPFARFWELGIGCILACIGNSQNIFSRWLWRMQQWRIMAPLGFGIILTALIFFDSKYIIPGFWALLPTLGAALIIADHPQSWINHKILSSGLMVWIGLISYPLYLVHWPMLVYARLLAGWHIAVTAGVITLSFAAAWLIYRFWEAPIRFGLGQKLKITLLCIAMCLIGCGGYWMTTSQFRPLLSNYKVDKILSAANKWDYPPPGFQQSVFDAVTVYTYPSSHPETTLYLGDSNMEQYAPRIARQIANAPAKTQSAVFFARGGCPPIQGVHEDAHPQCQGFIAAAEKYVLRPEVKTVVIAASWIQYFTELDTYVYIKDNGEWYSLVKTGEGRELALKALEDMLRRWRQAGKKVFLVLNIPSGPPMAPEAVGDRRSILLSILKSGDYLIQMPGLTRRDYGVRYNELKQSLVKLAKSAQITAIDPMDWLCDTSICPALDKTGEAIYKDATHIGPDYMRDQVDYLDVTLNLR